MFANLFTFEDCVQTENRIIYTDVILVEDADVEWEHGDGEIEAVFDIVNGLLYFGEYDPETQVYNKSKNFSVYI